ncbi:DUF4157 domain-containing protein [bacterium]|nr:DUF4157 domain-containing protein [bacterium]
MKPSSPVQRQEDEEELQMKPSSPVQRQEDEEELQMKPSSPVQRQEDEDELQMKPLAVDISRLQRTPAAPIRRAFVIQRDIEEEEEMVQGKHEHGPEGGEVEPSVTSQIQAARGSGRTLDEGVRGSMESGFGADFSKVRVHTGGQADKLNRSLNAKAFTLGNDVFFGKGQYNPSSSSGKRLLAHELTHTVQQGAAKVQREEMDEELAQAKNLKESNPIAQREDVAPLQRAFVVNTNVTSSKSMGDGAQASETGSLLENRVQRAPGLYTSDELREFGFKPGKKLSKSTWQKLEEKLDDYRNNVAVDDYALRLRQLEEIESITTKWKKEHINSKGMAKKSKEEGKAKFLTEFHEKVEKEIVKINKVKDMTFRIKLNGKELEPEETNNEDLYSLAAILVQGYEGNIWFNDVPEMTNWVEEKGKTEGIGVYKRKWLNFTNKGPIIWGEHHDAGKQQFIKGLNIKHFLVEGAHETSLHGHEVSGPEISESWKQTNQPYEGNAGGHAVENIWLKLAANVEHFWADLPNQLKGLGESGKYEGSGIVDVARLGELYDGIRVLKAVKDPESTDLDKRANKITDLVNKAKACITNLENAQWNTIEDELRQMGEMRGPFRDLKKKEGVKFAELSTNVEELFQCIVGIAKQQFKQLAKESELELDKKVNEDLGSTILEKWALRREIYQIKNIKAAFEKDPKPLLTTIGLRHAINQKEELESLLSPYKGKLIISATIEPLLDYGEKPK